MHRPRFTLRLLLILILVAGLGLGVVTLSLQNRRLRLENARLRATPWDLEVVSFLDSARLAFPQVSGSGRLLSLSEVSGEMKAFPEIALIEEMPNGPDAFAKGGPESAMSPDQGRKGTVTSPTTPAPVSSSPARGPERRIPRQR